MLTSVVGDEDMNPMVSRWMLFGSRASLCEMGRGGDCTSNGPSTNLGAWRRRLADRA